MDSSTEMQSTSLSLLDREESSKLDAVPTRNAFSSVKRLKEPMCPGRLSMKPIRLLALTQEWLEAENEPLKRVSESEENRDNDTDNQNKLDDKSIEVLQNAPKRDNKNLSKSIHADENSLDLGVLWLETPAKTNPHAKFGDRISAITPKINCGRFSATQSNNTVQDFISPYNTKIIKDDKLVRKPKIQYSMNIKGLLKTPSNNFAMQNEKHTCQSLTKLPAPQKPSSAFRNISSDNDLSDIINNKQTVLTPSIKNPNMVLQESNKENTAKKVQFTLPATKLTNTMFNEIAVKNVTYVILNQLGKGGSSVVYHCYDPKTKSEWAIKKVNLGSDANAVGYINEVKVLERLQKCDRIINMFDYEHIESERVLLVVLERGGRDLSKILKDLSNTSQHLPMHMLIFYWMEMLYAVKQIHENGIIHSDLKPGNFLKAEGGLKLIDFGIASCVQEDMTSVVKNVPVGSFNYISPEALTNEPSNNCESPSFGKPKFKVSYKSDVWSLGCILYQLVYRKMPFQHIGHTWAKLSAIVDPNHKIDYPPVDWVPPRVVNTIKKCLQYDMKARPSVDELIDEYENIYS